MPDFTTLSGMTPADFASILPLHEQYNRALPERILSLLESIQGAAPGMPVDALEHCRQTATRALRDGADDETVVCALVHDIGEAHAPNSHAEFAAAILEPYVSSANCWMVRHHSIFQGYYFWDKLGGDRDARERYRKEPHFQRTADFCERWDQVSFDPTYVSLPLEAFMPQLRAVFGRKPRSAMIGG